MSESPRRIVTVDVLSERRFEVIGSVELPGGRFLRLLPVKGRPIVRLVWEGLCE